MDSLLYYSKPGPLTNPEKHAGLLNGLPEDLASLCSVVQNNLIHIFWAERMGEHLTEARQATLQIRPVSEKLANIAQTNDQTLTPSPEPLINAK